MHGTGISLFQNPRLSKTGEGRPPVTLPTDQSIVYLTVMQQSMQFDWKHFYKASTLPSYYWEWYKVDSWERRSLDKSCSSINTSSMSFEDALPAICSILPLWEKLPHQSWSNMAWQFNNRPHHSQVKLQLLSLTSSCMQQLSMFNGLGLTLVRWCFALRLPNRDIRVQWEIFLKVPALLEISIITRFSMTP